MELFEKSTFVDFWWFCQNFRFFAKFSFFESHLWVFWNRGKQTNPKNSPLKQTNLWKLCSISLKTHQNAKWMRFFSIKIFWLLNTKNQKTFPGFIARPYKKFLSKFRYFVVSQKIYKSWLPFLFFDEIKILLCFSFSDS